MTEAAAIFGGPSLAFLVLTLVLYGGAALMTGRSLARGWRPFWQTVPYAALLAIGDRFLLYALFAGDLLSPSGYAVAAAVVWIIAASAYRLALVRLMLRQYPWLYERAGPFAWRERR